MEWCPPVRQWNFPRNWADLSDFSDFLHEVKNQLVMKHVGTLLIRKYLDDPNLGKIWTWNNSSVSQTRVFRELIKILKSFLMSQKNISDESLWGPFLNQKLGWLWNGSKRPKVAPVSPNENFQEICRTNIPDSFFRKVKWPSRMKNNGPLFWRKSWRKLAQNERFSVTSKNPYITKCWKYLKDGKNLYFIVGIPAVRKFASGQG